MDERMGQIMGDVTDPVWVDALVESERLAFQDATVVSEKLLDIRENIPGMFFLLPFVMTPTNIFRAGLAKFPLVATMKPLWKAFLRPGLVKMDVMRDNGISYTKQEIPADIANNIIAWGAFLALMSMWWDDDEDLPWITGTSSFDPGEVAAQFRTAPPMSIRLSTQPDPVTGEHTWVSYNRIEPFAVQLATMIDALDSLRRASEQEDTEGQWVDAIGNSFTAILRQTQDKTFMGSISDLFELFTAVTRDGPGAASGRAARMASRISSAFVTPNVFKQIGRAADPAIRDSKGLKKDTFMDEFWTRWKYESWPPLARNMPVKVDAWGPRHRARVTVQSAHKQLHVQAAGPAPSATHRPCRRRLGDLELEPPQPGGPDRPSTGQDRDDDQQGEGETNAR